MISLCITDPGSEVQAPVIVIGPKDTTVVAGNQATLECVANARYVYLFIYLFMYYSFSCSFIHPHARSQTQSHTKLNFHLALAERQKSTQFYTICCQIPHLFTQSGYTVVWLNRALFLSFFF